MKRIAVSQGHREEKNVALNATSSKNCCGGRLALAHLRGIGNGAPLGALVGASHRLRMAGEGAS